MTPNMYLELLRIDQDECEAIVDTMAYPDRISLRHALERAGCDRILRNLYYDYIKQHWIMDDAQMRAVFGPDDRCGYVRHV